MSEENALTGIKKRQQITNTRKQVFTWVALAAALVVICLVVGWNLMQRINYQNKVNRDVGKTAQTMHDNVEAADKLIKNVNALKANAALSLPNLKADDSTVFQVVIDALPTEDDSVALSSSLQNKILSKSGVTIEQINVDTTESDSSSGSSSSSSSSSGSSSSSSGSSSSSSKSGVSKADDIQFPVAKPITFRVSLVGSFDSVKSALQDIESTIRPITITKLTIDGSDDKLNATIEAQTYYSSKVNFKLGKKEIQYEKK